VLQAAELDVGRLENKIALITGSDSGIGKATAIAMAGEGADIVVTFYRDRDGAEDTARSVREAGREALVEQLDVRDEAAIDGVFDRALERFGRIDILVNNAGLNGSGVELADITTEQFEKVVRTNLFGYFFTMRRFVRDRRGAGGGGRIINVTSIHEEYPMHGSSDYDATKGGQQMLTRTLALEVAKDGILVNNLAPGMVLTPMNQEAVEDRRVREEAERFIPVKRAATPEDMAGVAVFLASDDASYITGESLLVDGGLTLQQGRGA
jgi:glucose 1-dehydrogenase